MQLFLDQFLIMTKNNTTEISVQKGNDEFVAIVKKSFHNQRVCHLDVNFKNLQRKSKDKENTDRKRYGGIMGDIGGKQITLASVQLTDKIIVKLDEEMRIDKLQTRENFECIFLVFEELTFPKTANFYV